MRYRPCGEKTGRWDRKKLWKMEKRNGNWSVARDYRQDYFT
jgi:hypothetical protein